MKKQEAIELSLTNWWGSDKSSMAAAAMWQLTERRPCMPPDVFHEGVEGALGRPVWTHEFTNPESLRDEAGAEGWDFSAIVRSNPASLKQEIADGASGWRKRQQRRHHGHH